MPVFMYKVQKEINFDDGGALNLTDKCFVAQAYKVTDVSNTYVRTSHTIMMFMPNLVLIS